MRHLLPILTILAGCAKEPPATPSGPVLPAFDQSQQATQYTPQGTTVRAPIVFVWGAVQGASAYTIEYQRGVVGMLGQYQYWSTARTQDTTTVVPLPPGVLNYARWRVIPIGPNNTTGASSQWMYFTLE
jgi:hypothetical protein